MQNIFIDVLPPWVETSLQPAFYDLESGTVLQQTARMWAKMREYGVAFSTFTENVVNEINAFEQNVNDNITQFEHDVNETVDEYISKFTALKDFVEDYFENLDVQEEINNKLDDMAEQGTLQEIITTYIQSNVEWVFNTVQDMKNATNLINGSYARTLGYYSANDGGGAVYIIVDTEPATQYETIGSLYAELIRGEDVNVDQYGAYGDGTHNDTTVIQNCLNENGIVGFNNKTYLVSSSLTVSSDQYIKGNETTIKMSTDNEAIVAAGESANKNIYQYTVTANESSDTLHISINGVITSVTLPSRTAGDKVYFNPYHNVCTWVSADYINEKEYATGTDSSGSDVTSQCTTVSALQPTSYVNNIKISGITFDYATPSTTKYAIKLVNANDVKIDNCNTTNNALLYAQTSLSVTGGSASTTADVYLKYGFSTGILSNNISVTNCNINGTEADSFSNISYDSSGIYFVYVNNVVCKNNNIKYLNHGISIWGGNVGPNNFKQEHMLRFANTYECSNNTIYFVKNGGIWGSRAGEITYSHNNISMCGDVGLDVEGTCDSLIDNNIVNDCVNGNLASFYLTTNTIFSNNIVKSNNILSTSVLFLYNDDVNKNVCSLSFFGNTFEAKGKAIKAMQFNNSNRGTVIIENNSFVDCWIRNDINRNTPFLQIQNNKFTHSAGTDLTNFEAFILLKAQNRSGSPMATINNNLFSVEYYSTSENRGKNNPDFDGKYAIKLTGSAWGHINQLNVENNKFIGFNKCFYLEHTGAAGDATAAFRVYMSNNLVSGPVDNQSDARGFIIYDNNHTIYVGDTSNFANMQTNYPNAIPTDTTHGGWMQGTKIYFDTPSGGYTEAICTVSGNVGTWKKCNQTE